MPSMRQAKIRVAWGRNMKKVCTWISPNEEGTDPTNSDHPDCEPVRGHATMPAPLFPEVVDTIQRTGLLTRDMVTPIPPEETSRHALPSGGLQPVVLSISGMGCVTHSCGYSSGYSATRRDVTDPDSLQSASKPIASVKLLAKMWLGSYCTKTGRVKNIEPGHFVLAAPDPWIC